MNRFNVSRMTVITDILAEAPRDKISRSIAKLPLAQRDALAGEFRAAVDDYADDKAQFRALYQFAVRHGFIQVTR